MSLQKALCSRQEAGAKNAAGAVFFLQASIVNCKQHVITMPGLKICEQFESAPLFCAKKTERYTCLVCVSTMLYMCGLLTSKTYLSFVPRFRYLRPPFKTSKVEGSTSKRRFPSMQICLPDIFWTQKWSDVRRQEGLGEECSLSECTWSYLS